MSMIEISCPGCQVVLNVPGECIGKRGKCQACGTRFVIDATLQRPPASPALDDSVIDWLSDSVAGANPLASTTTTQKHSAPATPPDKPSIGVADDKHFPLRLDRVDALGAVLIFDPQIMYDLDFRACLPQRCITCGYDRNLTVHPIFWASKQEKPPRGKTLEPLPQPASLEMHYNNRHGRDLLGVMERFKNMSPPFSLPFPFYVCNLCSAHGALMPDVRVNPATGHAQCLLTIASLPQAEAILRSALGATCPDADRIRAVRKADKAQPWRCLPLTVRMRINQWFTPREGEQFLSYIPDADATRDDMGQAGIILTGRRVVFCKGAKPIETPLNEQAIRIDMGPAAALLHVSFPTGTTLHLSASLRCATRLQRLLDRVQEKAAARHKEAG